MNKKNISILNPLHAFSGIHRPYLLLIISLFMSLSSLPAWGTNYYVSNAGSDSNDGLNLPTAFRTLQYAADQVLAGDTVLVEDGTYVGFNIFTSGSTGAPILFKALGSGAVINQPNSFTNKDGINVEGGSWVIIDGFTCQNLTRAGIRVVVADNCTIRNNTCLNNGVWGIFTGFTDDLLVENNQCANSQSQHGIYVSNSSDRSIIRNNECYGNSGSGIQINADASIGGDGISSDAQIYNNVIYENGFTGAAINLDGVVNAKIFNNLLYENHATGIALFQIDAASPSKNAKIFHNTIIHPSDGRWAINIVDGSTGAELYNNIIISKHSYRGTVNLDGVSSSGFVSNYNILTNRMGINAYPITLAEWQAQKGQDTNSQVADPLDTLFFLTSDNYQLLPESQAVDAGTTLTYAGASTDILGVSRPQNSAVDIGAYELLTSNSFEKWLEDNNLTGVDAKPTADPNRNGIPNIMEYALDFNPTDSSPFKQLPMFNISVHGFEKWAVFIWRQNNLANDLTYAVQYSDDLSLWKTLRIDGGDSIQTVLNDDIDNDLSASLIETKTKIFSDVKRIFFRLDVKMTDDQ